MGKSSCSSSAPRFANMSNISFSTSPTRAVSRSHLLITTIGRIPCPSAFMRTNLVCDIGPSVASTTRQTPSTMFIILSTSPPKSAWPGVSIRLIRHFSGPPPSEAFASGTTTTEAHLERIVIPRSCSSLFESITLEPISRSSRPVSLCFSKQSTSDVLPWSTCAIMATFRRSFLECRGGEAVDKQRAKCRAVGDEAGLCDGRGPERPIHGPAFESAGTRSHLTGGDTDGTHESARLITTACIVIVISIPNTTPHLTSTRRSGILRRCPCGGRTCGYLCVG
mmetsp:Transcript_25487/g.61388  ORF Transcript_25487/g.61388 Transcript_25487/m.61388 type:complete len:280 (+) Transcript_25487:1548-2387(+)